MRPLATFLSVLALVGECSAAESTAEVRVEVIDSRGESVDWATSVLFNEGDRSKHELVGNIGRVPFGDYTLRIEAQGFASQAHHVRIAQREYFVRIALDISDVGAGHTNRVSGKVIGKLADEQKIWVRLIPLVRNNSDLDYKLSDSSEFEFIGMPDGKCLILVLGSCPGSSSFPSLLTQKAISVSGRMKVDLSLEGISAIDPCTDRDAVK